MRLANINSRNAVLFLIQIFIFCFGAVIGESSHGDLVGSDAGKSPPLKIGNKFLTLKHPEDKLKDIIRAGEMAGHSLVLAQLSNVAHSFAALVKNCVRTLKAEGANIDPEKLDRAADKALNELLHESSMIARQAKHSVNNVAGIKKTAREESMEQLVYDLHEVVQHSRHMLTRTRWKLRGAEKMRFLRANPEATEAEALKHVDMSFKLDKHQNEFARQKNMYEQLLLRNVQDLVHEYRRKVLGHHLPEVRITDSSHPESTMPKSAYLKARLNPESSTKLGATDTPDAQLKATDTTDAQLKATDTTDAQLKAKDKTEAQLKATDTTDAQLKAKDKTDAQLKATDTTDAQLKAKDKTDAQLKAKDKTDAQLTGE